MRKISIEGIGEDDLEYFFEELAHLEVAGYKISEYEQAIFEDLHAGKYSVVNHISDDEHLEALIDMLEDSGDGEQSPIKEAIEIVSYFRRRIQEELFLESCKERK